MMHLTDRIASGKSRWEDVVLLQDVANQVKGKCLCALGDFSTEAVLSGIQRFQSDFEIKESDRTVEQSGDRTVVVR